VTLQLGHRELTLRERLGELVSEFLLTWEELKEELTDHGVGGIAELDVHVASARSDESWVESLPVVGGHHENTAFLRSDAIKSIEEAGERNLAASSFGDLLTFPEDSINVLQENDGVSRCLVESAVEPIVVQIVSREVQVADVQLQGASDGQGE